MKQQFEIRRILAVKVAVIAILLSIAQLASAQAFDYDKEKATDFYKFDEYGRLLNAKKTFHNAILYLDLRGETKLCYNDGNIVDFTSKIFKDILNRDYKSINISHYEYNYYNGDYHNGEIRWYDETYTVDKWFKEIMAKDVADSVYNSTVLLVHNPDVTVKANDGSTITIHYYGNGNGYNFEQKFNNGDHLKTRIYNDDITIAYLKKDFGDYKVTYNNKEDGTIIYDNGQIFKGNLIFLPEDVDYLKKGDRYSSFYNCEILKHDEYHDPYVLALGDIAIKTLRQNYYYKEYSWLKNTSLENKGYPLLFSPLVIGNIAKVLPYDGELMDKDGKIIDVFRNGEKLDDFDKMSVIGAKQAQIDKEKKAAADAIAQKEMIYKKYGKLSADALYNGEVVVGMSEQLFIIGANNYVFKKFSIVNKSIENSDYSRCYDLYKLNSNFSLVSVGYIWARDGKISSIHYY